MSDAKAVAAKTAKMLSALPKEERHNAVESLRRLIEQEMFDLSCGNADSAIACPRCGSLSFVKRGRDAHGSQRYLCRDCGRTFNGFARKVFATSKLPRSAWMAYAECFVDMLPLRECAARCGVSLKTSFFMRHRLLEALAKHSSSFYVEQGCGCELDETFFPESFKGNHSNSDFTMPRPPRRHSGKGYPGKKAWEKRPRGTGPEHICVLVGVNDRGDILYDVSCRGGLSTQSAKEVLDGKVCEGSVVCTDKGGAYPRALKELGVACHRAFAAADHKVNRINNVHSRLKTFMSRFHGVATRRLSAYLAWFKWHESFKHDRNGRDMAELAVRQVNDGVYDTVWRGYRSTPYPFFDYWEKLAC